MINTVLTQGITVMIIVGISRSCHGRLGVLCAHAMMTVYFL